MLLWGTDFHLNFLRQSPSVFGDYLMEENPEANGIIITGDISNGTLVAQHLEEFSSTFTKPIYFVLGNHDYYGSSFDRVDGEVAKVVAGVSNLHWLNQGWHIHEGVVLVGIGGWYDAYYGNANSTIELNDFYKIENLVSGIRDRRILIQLIRERAKEDADLFASMLGRHASLILMSSLLERIFLLMLKQHGMKAITVKGISFHGLVQKQ